MHLPVIGGFVRSVAHLHGFREQTLPQGNYLVFFRGAPAWQFWCFVQLQGRRGHHGIYASGVATGASPAHTTRVLPAFPAGVPMKAKFFQLVSDFLEWRDGKIQPDPFAYNLRLAPNLRHVGFQPVEELQRVQLACIICIHGYSLSAVHLHEQVASGLVTLTGSADGTLFSSESRAAVWRRKMASPRKREAVGQ